MSYGHVRDANVMRTALIAFKYNLKTSQIIKICTDTFDTLTLLTLSYKKSKMRAILGTIVYILIRSIGRRAIKKIESVKSVMSFFVQSRTKISPIVSYFLVIRWIFVSHCTPGSYDEGSFNRNRSITLVVVGLAILSFALCLIFVPAHEDYYIRHYHMGIYNDTKYQLLQILSIISFCTLGISCIISWIMLSIMAFRQLPNPRGYKIYTLTGQRK